jgi:predicted  nucleic acid-binding Zn-ribbon protein
MKKYQCTICGEVIESDTMPETCPVCGVDTFIEIEEGAEKVYADEHRVGVAKGLDEEVVQGLRDNFTGEFSACFSEEAMMKTQEDIRKLDDEIGRLSKTGAWEKAELDGFTPADDENAPSYMVAGGFVYVTGEAINITGLPGGAEIKALTLPKALCPRRKQEFLCRAGAYILAVIVNTDGGVCIFNPGAQELPQNSEVVFSFSYGL